MRQRRLRYSGGPLDGQEIPFVWPLDTKIRVDGHRYVLEDEPKMIHPNGDGCLTLEYRYEGPRTARNAH